jgi:hypothetical protein
VTRDVYTRRALLAALPPVALAGCSSADEPSPGANGASSPTPGSDTTTAFPTRTTAGGTTTAAETTDTPTGTPTPDLREANVTGVTASRTDGEYRFDVTLYHDDDGEDGYANWWQVETLDGDRLGRRDLLHAHGTREFTRSASVPVPDGASCVVVRGHDETHGYGGRAAVVSLDSGTVSFVDQGPDPRSFEASECP